MKVCMRRVAGKPPFTEYRFEPSTLEDMKALAGCDEIIFELKKNRSPGNHRRYFAFIKQAFDMQEHFDSIEIFRKYIQVQAGHFDLVVSPKNGEAAYWPRSIDWDKLDETEFKQLFGEVVNAFLKVYGERLDSYQVDQIIRF